MAIEPKILPDPIEDEHAALERALIEEFLASVGYRSDTLRDLPAAQCRDIMRYAATYATLRLAEIEARADYVHALSGTHP